MNSTQWAVASMDSLTLKPGISTVCTIPEEVKTFAASVLTASHRLNSTKASNRFVISEIDRPVKFNGQVKFVR